MGGLPNDLIADRMTVRRDTRLQSTQPGTSGVIHGNREEPTPPFGLKELSMRESSVAVFFICSFLLLAITFSSSTVFAASMGGPYNGKYTDMRNTFYAPNDRRTYGDSYDRGYRDSSRYGRTDVPAGYWVYSYPYWYVYSKKSPSYGGMNNRHNNDRNNNSRRNYNHGMDYDQGRNWNWSWGWSQ
jgi:hypothetical protein